MSIVGFPGAARWQGMEGVALSSMTASGETIVTRVASCGRGVVFTGTRVGAKWDAMDDVGLGETELVGIAEGGRLVGMEDEVGSVFTLIIPGKLQPTNIERVKKTSANKERLIMYCLLSALHCTLNPPGYKPSAAAS